MDFRDIFVAPLFRYVGQFMERDRPNTELVVKVLDQLLRIKWTIEGFTCSILTAAGVVVTDDDMVGSIVTSN
jgi:hypothetical protein